MSRRAFVGGALAAGAVSIPLLRSIGTRAQDTTFPKRLVVFFSANGTAHENWVPNGGETDFELSRILAPLEAFKSKLLILDGVDMASSDHGPGDGHQRGMGHMLTGTELLEGDEFEGGNGELVGWGGGISVDQFVANAVGGDTRFRSLELGVDPGGANIWTRMCYRDSNQPVPPEGDPRAVFDRVFSDLSTEDRDAAERRRQQRRSVLDFVRADLGRMSSRLPREDRPKLDAHLTAIRDLETRLQAPLGVGAACTLPTPPGGELDPGANDDYPAVGRAQMDLLVMSLACDLTRVASLQWSKSVSNTTFSWLDIPEGHHDLSHEGDSNGDAIEKITRINVWYSEQLAYLLGRMQEIPEGEGTLLDNSLVLWCNELGRGNSHSRNRIPWVLAGGAGGYFRMGRFLEYDSAPHNDLLVSVCNAMGVETDSFGNPAYCNGPLPRLV
ncbi:MAG: DUF1552 domain-containing protein [Deltaproteobacteria bacterium]|nr:DUF1552 domain-containing protein [Deltaproteobacteria bacterium]